MIPILNLTKSNDSSTFDEILDTKYLNDSQENVCFG
jgi:hypothetical protein